MNTLQDPINAVLRTSRRAFSLVEMLASVAIIGVITFLAIPNLVQMRSDSELNLAIARAEAINMAIATYIQATGRTQAISNYGATSSTQAQYSLFSPYLAFSQTLITDYMPNGYSVTFPNVIDPLKKVTLSQGATTVSY